jgi:hypothetical protein
LKMTFLLASVVFSGLTQTNFQNLNFESANLASTPRPYPNLVPIASALHGWNAYVGAVQQTQVQQDAYGTGGASVDVFGPSYSAAGPTFSGGFQPGVIDGKYSVLLQAGLLNDGITPENVSIEQAGTVPQGAESLQFKAWQTAQTPFTVAFDGNTLSPVVLGSGANYTLYGVNIAPYAGQTGPLEFTSDFVTPGAPWLGLDDISFSTSSVPEPSPAVLASIGGLLFALLQRIVRRR